MTTFVTETSNARRAHSYGLEADLRFKVRDDLILNGGFLVGRSE